jgi:hypothetical protein
VFLTNCTGLPFHFLVGLRPDKDARLRAHCLVKSGELISLQQQLHSYITSWFTHGFALLRSVKPSQQFRRHSFTLQPLLPYHCRNVGLGLCRSHPLPNSRVLPHPPSCSTNPRGGTAAIFYYLSSRRQPTLPPTSPYLRAISFFNFQPSPVFLRHSHTYSSHTSTATTSLAA